MTQESKKIVIAGSGMMGHGIGQEFAMAGHRVTFLGRSMEKMAKDIQKIERNLNELCEWGLTTKEKVPKALEKISATISLEEAAQDADLVVEAIIEDLDIKKQLFSRLDQACPAHTILASNTSTIMPSMLDTATKRPDRVVVAHYFNPPYLMPLVEIVRGKLTSDKTVDFLYNLLKSIGKDPIVCQKEAPGFIVNRLQMVLWREAFNIVQRGIASPQDVDLSVKKSFGRRLGIAGPFEIYEHNDGYDLTAQCEEYMLDDMDTATKQSYPLLLEMVEKGLLGAKTGQGFYEWTPEFTENWRKAMVKNLVGYLKK
jgi:3-hydroxybutyryl-CoA dehydrogenase